ncbi:MAG: N-acetyltransferase [Desulfobacteraceae bacterium]|nr:N-acetyltransferase [Desulfobacteraceae bacterium]
MIRKATIEDIKTIHAILKHYGSKGDLLARPLSRLYDHVRDFSVWEDPDTGQILGCCALQFCWEDLAEIRSLAVVESHFDKKIGTRLVETAFDEARQFKIKKLFTLTYRPDFFKKFGFIVIDKAELPIKIWTDCIHCVKFPDCDETALLKQL